MDLVLTHRRLAVDDLRRPFLDFEAHLRGRATLWIVLYVLALAAAIPIGLARPPGGFALAIVASMVFFWRRSRRNRALEKVRFVLELAGLLEDELAPRAKVVVDFDLRHYDEEEKRTWSGRSSAGNPKHRYSDKWLCLRARLADGTALELVRQAGLKTKKGSIVKEKRRLFLTLRPSPRRYPVIGIARKSPAAAKLRQWLSEGVREFHNAPEAFDVKVGEGEQTLRLKVMQEDAPILAREVFVLVDRSLRFLAWLQRQGPSASAAGPRPAQA